MPPFLVWYIDDDTQTARDIISYWKSLEGVTIKFQFQYFSTARAAWEAFVTTNEPPQAIIVDGHLKADEGEMGNGANFVRQVRSHSDSLQPILLGFSGDDYALEFMVSAGAEAGFYKGNVRAIYRYLKTHFENLQSHQISK